MEHTTAFMLAVWREASRHIEITEFAATLAAMITQYLPIERLIIQKIDQERSRIETLGLHSNQTKKQRPPEPIEWPARDLARLLRWRRQGEVQHRTVGGRTQ